MKLKKIKRSTAIAWALLVYVSATAAYLLPRNTGISTTEKYLTVGASYVIILLVWLLLRKKEQLQRRRNEEESNQLKK